MDFNPELLAPAGNLEKLKVAVLYGADAVYLSGHKFGMRAGADNFTNADIERGVSFAKRHNVKVYVTLNMFFHDEDFLGLSEFCLFLESVGVEGVIVSDIGVVNFIRINSKLEVHVSTQSSCLNSEDARVWKDLGATRIVVGRELSIEQASRIKREVGIEVEMFTHGAMCMAYSGNCVISNFTAGRDSNRGGCIQSCRFPYKQTAKKGLEILEDQTTESHVISSKDMMGVAYVPKFVSAQIDSLKIEGRMKSALYVATTTMAYRKALDAVTRNCFDSKLVAELENSLNAIPHRDYFPASFEVQAPNDSTYEDDYGTTSNGTHRMVGLVVENSTEFVAIKSNVSLSSGSQIEFLKFDGSASSVTLQSLYDCGGVQIDQARPGSVFCTPRNETLKSVQPYSVVREFCREV